MGLALAVAGCGGAGSNEEGGGDDGNGDDGGDGGTGLSAPAAPSGLEATPQDGAAQLTWDTVDGADTYRVYRDTSSGVDASSSPLDTGIDQSSYTDETAEEGTEYFYAVSAVASEDGESAESDLSGEASAALLGSPSGLSATPADGSTQLSWEAAGGADTYNVYRSTSSGVDASSDPLGTGISPTEYTDESAQNGTEYFYVVTAAASGDRESDPSGEVSAVPFAAPSGLEGTSRDSEIALSWEAAGGAETYNVYRSTSSGVDVSASPLDTGISSSEYTDGSAENGTKYYYRVTSVNPGGAESDASSEVEKTPFADPPNRPNSTERP
ncbi:fibronectin type III domain-containing protein [Salinibacter ruber]|uniref:fibronectin type III domain-containing protein n=1 Tax=Salinibacter ruber TaxID=146919 RepID=UPI00216859AD|nr:cellulose 1,4-beta-cellobiosidase [Salinibacter ruber]